MRTLMMAALAVATSVSLASAHSDDMTTMPADGDTVQMIPESVMFTFDDAIRMTRVQLNHASHTEMDLDLGDQQSFATEYSLPMMDMGAGTYLIEWRGLGIDGHPVEGAFSFVVE